MSDIKSKNIINAEAGVTLPGGDVQTQINGRIASTEKAAANGVATLDATTKIPAAQMPTNVGGSIYSFRKFDDGGTAGTIPYYSWPVNNNQGVFTWAADTPRCVPFPSPNNKVVSSIAINITTAIALGEVRIAIYTDSGNIYPGALLHDFGIFNAATTGFKELTGQSVALSANTLYWLCANFNGAIGTAVVTPNNGIPNMLGFNASGAASFSHYRGSFAYGAFPDPFTLTGGDLATGGAPLIFLKFSS